MALGVVDGELDDRGACGSAGVQSPSKKPDVVYTFPKQKLMTQSESESPLERCQVETYQKKKSDELTSHYSEFSREENSLRERAEESLTKGICLIEWFGEAYCHNFNAKQTQIQSNPLEDTWEAAPPTVAPVNNTALTTSITTSSEEEAKMEEKVTAWFTSVICGAAELTAQRWCRACLGQGSGSYRNFAATDRSSSCFPIAPVSS